MFKQLLTLIAFCGLMACARVPFTQSIKDNVTATDSNAVQSLQFYIDRLIVLERISKTKFSGIQGGKINYQNGEYRELFYIKQGTKAVCKPNGGALKVFIGLADNEYLPFREMNGVYRLDITAHSGGKWVTYSGEKFRVNLGWDAELLVGKDGITTKKQSVKIAKGVKLGQK